MKRLSLILISAATVVAACGGGGSSTLTNTPPTAGPASLVITVDNAKPAARVAYSSTLQSVDAGNQVAGSGIAADSGGGLQKSRLHDFAAKAVPRSVQIGAFGPEIEACAIGGTTTTSGVLSGILGFNAGDQINIESSDCEDVPGQIVNGRLEMTVVSYSGDLLSGLYRLEMSVDLIDFEIVTATDTIRSNGDSTTVIDTTGLPLFALSVSGSSMTTQFNTQSATLSNYSTAQTVDTSVVPEPYTLSSNGTVDSSELDGTISFSTPVTFQGTGTGYPFAGELLVTGEGGATIRLIALDSTNVRIETDTDGNGVVDASEDTTWDDIASPIASLL